MDVKKSHIRVLHAVPNAPAVDVYINENIVVEALGYSKFTPYLPVQPGTYKVDVYATGTSENPLIESQLTVPADKIYTVAAIGLPSSPSLYPIEDTKSKLKAGDLGLRFIHLSPDAPAVTVKTKGKAFFQDFKYKDVTDYFELPPGKYTFEVFLASDQSKPILVVPNVVLKGYRYYSFIIIGLTNMPPGIEAVIPLDGSSYL